MSADNYMEVDHDGENFIVRHGFMSSVGEEDEEGELYEAPIIGTVKTEMEVLDIIEDYFIIEYGVNWSCAARAACGAAPVDPVDDKEYMMYDVDVELANDLNKRFTYHTPKEDQPQRYNDLREQARFLAWAICESCPESRERSLALTNLEQAIFWANASIARNE